MFRSKWRIRNFFVLCVGRVCWKLTVPLQSVTKYFSPPLLQQDKGNCMRCFCLLREEESGSANRQLTTSRNVPLFFFLRLGFFFFFLFPFRTHKTEGKSPLANPPPSSSLLLQGVEMGWMDIYEGCKSDARMGGERKGERERKKEISPPPPLFFYVPVQTRAREEWRTLKWSALHCCWLLPNQQRTLNKLPTELRCRNFANKHRLSIQIGTKHAKMCMRCVHIPTELPFCTPPLVVGCALSWKTLPCP